MVEIFDGLFMWDLFLNFKVGTVLQFGSGWPMMTNVEFVELLLMVVVPTVKFLVMTVH